MLEQLLELFNKHNLLSLKQIINLLNLKTEEEIKDLEITIQTLEDQYIIMHNSKNDYGLLTSFQYAKGIIDIKDGGFGFVITEIGDIHIYSSKINSALNKDEVLVTYYLTKDNKLEGRVVKIITRNTTEIIGTVKKKKNSYFVHSIDKKVNIVIYLINDPLANTSIDYVVKVHIDKYYSNNTADGKIIKIIGKENEVGVDIDSIIEASSVKVSFSKDALLEASKIKQFVDVNSYPNRKDLSNELIITIDGDDAKDFDDAVTVKKLANGNYCLGVYIADVTEYVTENSYLDQDALERGTSVYLPDRVIPMLPFELSNGICSLNENVKRLVMACEMEIDLQGKVVNQQIFEAIITSTHRMTYQKVNKMLEDNDHNLINEYKDIYLMLKDMASLAIVLQNMRIERGAFEFETLEPQLILDNKGKVVEVVNRELRTAEKMIEEFMLIANETVASTMTWLDVPFIYRVHDKPTEEKVNNFLLLLDGLGIPCKVKNKLAIPKILQAVLLDETINKDPEKKAVVNKMLLRSMAKAKYQENNIGHFGLASECYTHFTSPIRRYPDLLVHRLIKEFLLNHSQLKNQNPTTYYQQKVTEASFIASAKEREAENLERDCVKYKLCEYMEPYIGKMFNGTISSIVNWGMYVTINEVIEGLVAYENMPDYEYHVETLYGYVQGFPSKHIYKLGDKIRVKIIGVNKIKREIDLRLFLGGFDNGKGKGRKNSNSK